MKKTVLFLSLSNMAAPLMAAEMELMHRHRDDEIYILSCPRALLTCSANRELKKSRCVKCQAGFDQLIELMSIPKENILPIKRQPFKKYTFKDQQALSAFEIDGVHLGFCVNATMVYDLRDTDYQPPQHQWEVNRKLNTAHSIYRSTLDAIEQLKPDCFYCLNGRMVDSWPATIACQQRGVTYYTYEQAEVRTHYAVYKNATIHESFAEIGSQMAKTWDGVGKAGEQWFQSWIKKGMFTKEQAKHALPDGFDPTQRNVAFFNSSVDEFALFPSMKEPIFGGEIFALQETAKALPSIQFYARIHPNLSNLNNHQMRELHKLDQEKIPNLHFIWPKEKVDSYALIEAVDKVIVFGSTIGVEACYLGTPSILLGRAFYESTGCSYRPKDRAEFFHMLESDLEPKPKDRALQYGNWCALGGHPYLRYKPYDDCKGAFDGVELKPTLKGRQKLLFKWFRRIEQTANSIRKRVPRKKP